MPKVPGAEGYDCGPPEPVGSVPTLTMTSVATGLSHPSFVTHAGADPRLFVVEHEGRVRIIQDGQLLPTPFLDIADRVASTEDDPEPGQANRDRGLAGLTFHPDFAENGIFYVHYQAHGSADGGASAFETGTTVVSEFTVSGSDPNVAEPSSENVLMSQAQPGEDHNGGTIAFGPDGMLYIALGDGRGWNTTVEDQFADPEGNGQNPATVLGAILRIDPSPTPGGTYGIPSGNVKEMVATADERVWDYGLRNPFRMNFDGCTGVLYIGDVGRTGFEEVNIEMPGDGGHNYGWPIMEGAECYESGCDQTGLTLPRLTYVWEDGVSVIGGTVYRGRAIPSLHGVYLYADYFHGRLESLIFDPMTGYVSDGPGLGVTLTAPTSLQNGPDGEVYVTYYLEAPYGEVRRLDPL